METLSALFTLWREQAGVKESVATTTTAGLLLPAGRWRAGMCFCRAGQLGPGGAGSGRRV
jgi:hypothetical protein